MAAATSSPSLHSHSLPRIGDSHTLPGMDRVVLWLELLVPGQAWWEACGDHDSCPTPQEQEQAVRRNGKGHTWLDVTLLTDRRGCPKLHSQPVSVLLFPFTLNTGH